MTRTVRDAALLLDAIAGYDANDPITAHAVGLVPDSYAGQSRHRRLRGARIGVIRESMDPKTTPTPRTTRRCGPLIDRALADMRTLGASIVDPVVVPGLNLHSGCTSPTTSRPSGR